MADIKTIEPSGVDRVTALAMLKARYQERATGTTDVDDESGGSVSLKGLPNTTVINNFATTARVAEGEPKTASTPQSAASLVARVSLPNGPYNVTPYLETIGNTNASSNIPSTHYHDIGGFQSDPRVGSTNGALARGPPAFAMGLTNAVHNGSFHSIVNPLAKGPHGSNGNVTNGSFNVPQETVGLNPGTKTWAPNENFVRVRSRASYPDFKVLTPSDGGKA